MTTAEQIDVTSCEKILRYLERDPAITGVVEVIDARTSLAQVGDLFLDETAVEKVKELIDTKKIISYSKRENCKTPHKNAVHCLRLEPFILIKNLNKLYI